MTEDVDIAAVGAGPFNLALAALGDGVAGLRVRVFEQRPEFRWHPGLLIEGTTLQVPFLADLVTLVDPTSRWSFLNYLRSTGRLFPFYFAERFHMARAEYEAYCRWVADGLGCCRFDRRVTSVTVDPGTGRFLLGGVTARHLVLGVGTEPVLPEPLRGLPGVLHSSEYLRCRDALLAAPSVTVVGAGQSGAEVFLDLLRRRGGGGLCWLARTAAFAPMEYSKLGLEQFTPDYTAYFHGLPAPVRDELVPAQWQLYKGISADTIGQIHDELYERTVGTPAGSWPDVTLLPGVAVTGAAVTAAGGRVRLTVHHVHQGTTAVLSTDAVVAATGYAERPLDQVLGPLAGHIAVDHVGRPAVDADYRLDLDVPAAGSVFVQNAERHTHGVGAPDLGLAAWRAAVILNATCGREVYPLPERTAFTTFGLPATGGDPA